MIESGTTYSGTSFTCPVLVGRTKELAALLSFLDTSGSGAGQVALIHGEAGVGKSRLVAEARAAALSRGFLALEGDCYLSDLARPYAPILDLLRVHFTGSHNFNHHPDSEPLVREMVRLLPDLDLAFPQAGEAAAPPALDPQQHKRRLFAVLTQFFSNQADRQPVLLIVEDLQWCDESSLDLLLHLVRRCAGRPLSFLFTYRTDDQSPGLTGWLAQLDREGLAVELALERLSQMEVEAMLQAIFAAPYRLTPDLLNRLYNLTDGNPFFVEETLKSLSASGDLLFMEGSWRFKPGPTSDAELTSVPRSVDDAVRQRVDRLSPAARQALILAAVAGRRFDFNLLQRALACEDDHLLAVMRELTAAQLVVEVSEDLFAFRHALGQQAVYRMLLARERKSLHRRIADTLEAIRESPIEREAHLEELAAQFYAAGDWTKALTYQQQAGERALALDAPGPAIEKLTRALEAAGHLGDTPAGRLYYARGRAYAARGAFDLALQDYERALEAARLAVDGVLEWQCMLATGFLWAGRDYAEAGAWFRQASDLATRLANPTLRARSLNRLGNWLVNTGRIEEGQQVHQEALVIFEHQEDKPGMAETLDLLGITWGMRGDRLLAVELLGRAIELFQQVNDVQSLASSFAMRALQSMPGACETTYSPLRKRDECVQDASEALRLARQGDSTAGQAFAENALAQTLLAFGEFGPALSHAREAWRISNEIEHQQWMIAAQFCFGNIYLHLLAPARAVEVLQSGLVLTRKLGSMFWESTLAVHLGWAYILSGDLASATGALEQVMPREQSPRNIAERDAALAWGELALAQGHPDLALQLAVRLLETSPSRNPVQPAQPIPHLLRLKGEALLDLSRPEEAAVALEEAVRGAQERNAGPMLWTTWRALGRAYDALHQKNQAQVAWVLARQTVEELAATLEDATLRDHFTHSALDTLPGARSLTVGKAAGQGSGGLTRREREVAALVSQGKTSREIAGLLVVSERTVEVHVGNILRKLGFTSRSQIAAWAIETRFDKR